MNQPNLGGTPADNADSNTPLRMHIALTVLRAWNSGTAGYDGEVVVTIYDWIDSGMSGPIPWPTSPFFDEWATEHGYSSVGGYIGFRFQANLVEPKAAGQDDSAHRAPTGGI